nr:MAG TPA: hypothetical protein [Caudoviricetes sp.]
MGLLDNYTSDEITQEVDDYFESEDFDPGVIE